MTVLQAAYEGTATQFLNEPNLHLLFFVTWQCTGLHIFRVVGIIFILFILDLKKVEKSKSVKSFITAGLGIAASFKAYYKH